VEYIIPNNNEIAKQVKDAVDRISAIVDVQREKIKKKVKGIEQ